MSYTVTIEGQKIPLPDEIGSSDDKVRQALAPYFPDAANALITRSEKEGEVTINVVKKAGTKGLLEGLDMLTDCAPNRKNPAVALHDELKSASQELSAEQLLVLDKRIEDAIKDGERQRDALVHAIRRLIEARPQPAPAVVRGF